MRFAVIGNPINHSLSPQIHRNFAKQRGIELCYTRLTGELSTFEQQVRNFFLEGGKGLNVTAPFKERAFAMAEKITARCEQAKAANTLWMQEGLLYADNTDGIGFIRDIKRYRQLTGKSLLLLGAGGAARGILGPILAENPGQVAVANRSPEKAWILARDFSPLLKVEVITQFSDIQNPFDIVVNCRPAKTLNALSFPKKAFGRQTFAYDLGYDRENKTAFLHFAKENGFAAVDGLGMLIEQAAEAFKIWQQCPQAVLDYTILDF